MKDFLPTMAVLSATASFIMLFFVMGTMRLDAIVCWACCVTSCIVFLSLTKRQVDRDRKRRERSHFEWRKKCGLEQ